MADLIFTLDADTSKAQEAFDDILAQAAELGGSIEEMLTKSLGNKKIAIDVEINAEGDADVTLREVYSLYERIENAVDKAQKAQAKANAEAEKAAAIQKGSLTNLQQILRTEEEKLRQIKAGTTEYAQQREIVSRLKGEVETQQRAQKGLEEIQKDSLSDLQQILSLEQERLNGIKSGSSAYDQQLEYVRLIKQEVEKEQAAQKEKIQVIKGTLPALQATLQAERDKLNTLALGTDEYENQLQIINYYQAKVREATRANELGFKAQQGSAAVLSQQLAFEKQKLAAIKRGTTEYETQLKVVKEINAALEFEELGTFGVFAKQLGQGLDVFNKIQFGIRGIIEGFGVLIRAAEAFAETQSKIATFQRTFEAIGAGVTGSQVAFQEATRIALGLGVSIDSVRFGYSKLAPTILQTGGSLSDVSNVVQALSSRFTAFGLSADQANRVMNGVVQAFAKGRLYAEELNQQISEADPAFRVDLANALGVTVVQLQEFIKNGEITSDVLLDIIPKLDKSKEVFGLFGASAISATKALQQSSKYLPQVIQQLDNFAQLNFEKFGQAFAPVIGAILQVRAAWEDLIAALLESNTFKVLADIIGEVAQAFAGIITIISQVAQGFIAILEPIAAFINVLQDIPVISEIITAAIVAATIPALIQLGTAAVGASKGLIVLISTKVAVYFAGLATAVQVGAIALYNFAVASVANAQAAMANIGASVVALTAKFRALTVAILSNPLGLVIVAAMTSAAAFDTYNRSVGAAQDETIQLNRSLGELGNAQSANQKTTLENQAAYESAVARVGELQANLDRVRNAFGLVTAEQASYNQNTIAVAQSQQTLSDTAAKLTKEFQNSGNAQTRSVETTNALQGKYDQLQGAIQETIARYGVQIKALESTSAGDAKQAAAKQALIDQYKTSVIALEAESKLLYENAKATGLATEETQRLSQAEGERAIAKINAINGEIEAIRRRVEEETAFEQRQADLIRQQIDLRKQSYDQAKQEATEYYDTAINAAQRQLDAERSVAQERIKSIEAQKGAAELALEEYEYQKLVQKALTASTYEESLRANAALERINREKDAAYEKAAWEEEEKQRQEEIAKLKEAKERELAQLEQQFRDDTRAWQDELKGLLESIAGKKAAALKEEAALTKEVAKIQKEYGPQIAAAQERTAKALGETGDAANKLKDAQVKTVNASGSVAGNMERQATAAERVVRAANSYVPPKFAGGFVGAGQQYTVNEFGKEAFLTRGGKLSWINAPAWGKWRAPSDGTIIPAHIAAGMNIPASGLNLRNANGIMNKAVSATGGSNSARMYNLTRSLYGALATRDNGITKDQLANMTAIQARQALQIGKLTRAVNRLANKDLSVDVTLKGASYNGNGFNHAMNILG